MTTHRSTTRSRPPVARRLTRWACAVAGATALVSAALASVALPAGAASGLKPGDSLGCWSYPHPDGGHRTASIAGRGSVTYYERGEYLTVRDTSSNGWRVVALFSWCEGPLLGLGTFHWSPTTSDGWQHRDSGPNQGAVDEKTYNYDFEEGRRVIFRACEKQMSTGQLRNCTNTVEMWS